jgi:hypothetical protein
MLKVVIATAALLGATAVIAAAPRHFAGAKLLPQAKITLAQARQTAVRAHPGVITDQELEKERGGTGLRYSFDIKNNGKTFEVGVSSAIDVRRVCAGWTPHLRQLAGYSIEKAHL